MSQLLHSLTSSIRSKNSILFFALLLISLTSAGQDKYYSNHPALKAKDYLRSQQFISSRADEQGSMKHYIETMQMVKDSLRLTLEHTKNLKQSTDQRNAYRQTQFYPLGPSVTTDPVLAQLGLVSALWVDTTDFQTIYAGSNTGGIFATYDGGQNWQPLSDNYITTGILAIEVDRDDDQHIFVGTGHWGFNRAYGQGVMESKDGGDTWSSTGLNASTLSSGFLIHDVKQHQVNADTLYALLNTEFKGKTSIYRSTNKAKDWEPTFTQDKEELFDIVVTPGKPDHIYAVGSLLLRSFDAGTTWQDITYRIHLKPDHKMSRLVLALSDSIPGLMLVFTESYDTLNPSNWEHQLFRSTNRGRDFFEMGIEFLPFVGYWKMELQISPADPAEFYLGGIWFSKYRMEGDSAIYLNYHNHKYHKDVRELLVFKGDSADKVYMGNDGGVTRSDDGTITWLDITRNGMQTTQLHNITISDKGNMVYGGPQDGNLCFYNYETGEWTKETHIGDAYDGMVDYKNPKNVYMVTIPPKLNRRNIFLLKSTDAGLSFDYRGVPDTTEQGRNNIPVTMHPTDPKILYAGLKNVWKSTDGAETWEQISNFSQIKPQKVQAIEISASNPDVICTSFENPSWGNIQEEKIMITIDGGNRWNDITPRGSLSMQYVSATDILIHPEKPGTIYLALDRTWVNRRIYVTNDGGRTWENFSEGIPAIPVNAIRYFKGAGYDILLAATDAGIYYRDALMNRWEFFGEGLPLTIISDIEINYARKKLVVGTFGRGLWEADLCLPLDETSLIITDTVEWAPGKNLLSDLILMPGSMLTIKNRVEIGDGRTIKVMPGAQLILDKATLTNNCISLWEGIKLYGHADYNSRLPQGQITIIHGSVIENAYTGIEMIDIDEDGNENPSRGGGIIITDNAVFRNNLRAIDIKPTKGINPSIFKLTEFSLKDQPWPGERMKEFVRINDNSGIEFISCVFRNDIPYLKLPVNDRGNGITSYNASLKIYRLNADSVPFGLATKPLFYQLKTGIDATTSTPGYSYYSEEALFKNNFTGAYISGYSILEVNKCDFEFSALNNTDNPDKEISGLYLDNCAYFNIIGNNFKGPAFPGFHQELAGLVINNCGDNNNLIAGNSFDYLNYSLLAQNRNRNDKGDEGLRLSYNMFNKNEYDICITNDSAKAVNGIAYHQGALGVSPLEPAGNQFSYGKFHRTSDFHNDGEPVMYSHYIHTTGKSRQEPRLYANLWLVPGVTTTIPDSNYLPSYLTIDTGMIHQSRLLWETNAATALDEYTNVKDGGNSTALMNEISSTSPETASRLYKKLRQLDSKLSVEALRELLGNNYFHNTLLIDVLVNNPIIFRNSDLLELIMNREPKMPDYMLHKLVDRYSIYSMIELLESRSNNAEAVKDALLTRVMSQLYIINQGMPINSFAALLKNDDRLATAFILAFMHHVIGDTLKAEEAFEDAELNFPKEKTTIENMVWLMKLDKSLRSSVSDTLTLPEYQLIQELLENEATFIYVQNILRHYNKTNYIEPYILPGEAPIAPIFEIPEINITGSGFKIYPQPASSYIILDYYYESGIESGELQLTNLTGQIIARIPVKSPYGQELLDVSTLLPGLYIARLVSNNTILERQKVMIIR